jgi:hypothetical protein
MTGLGFGSGYVLTYPREDAGDQFRVRISETADGWRWSCERQLAEGQPFRELVAKVTAARPAPSAARRWGDRQIRW